MANAIGSTRASARARKACALAAAGRFGDAARLMVAGLLQARDATHVTPIDEDERREVAEACAALAERYPESPGAQWLIGSLYAAAQDAAAGAAAAGALPYSSAPLWFRCYADLLIAELARQERSTSASDDEPAAHSSYTERASCPLFRTAEHGGCFASVVCDAPAEPQDPLACRRPDYLGCVHFARHRYRRTGAGWVCPVPDEALREARRSLRAGDPSTAMQLIREALKADPGEHRLHQLLASALHRQGHNARAYKAAASAADLSPGQAALHTLLSTIAADLDERELAQWHARQSMRLSGVAPPEAQWGEGAAFVSERYGYIVTTLPPGWVRRPAHRGGHDADSYWKSGTTDPNAPSIAVYVRPGERANKDLLADCRTRSDTVMTEHPDVVAGFPGVMATRVFEYMGTTTAGHSVDRSFCAHGLEYEIHAGYPTAQGAQAELDIRQFLDGFVPADPAHIPSPQPDLGREEAVPLVLREWLGAHPRREEHVERCIAAFGQSAVAGLLDALSSVPRDNLSAGLECVEYAHEVVPSWETELTCAIYKRTALLWREAGRPDRAHAPLDKGIAFCDTLTKEADRVASQFGPGVGASMRAPAVEQREQLQALLTQA